MQQHALLKEMRKITYIYICTHTCTIYASLPTRLTSTSIIYTYLHNIHAYTTYLDPQKRSTCLLIAKCVLLLPRKHRNCQLHVPQPFLLILA